MSQLIEFQAPLRSVFPRHYPPLAARTLSVFNQLRRFERLPSFEQEKVLGAQLRDLLAHAARHSPLWRERLPAGFEDCETIATILEQIPPLTRADLREGFDRLRANFEGREKLRISTVTTSGSTGSPVKVERAEYSYRPSYYATAMVTAAWHGIDPKKSLGIISHQVEDKEAVPMGAPFRWFGPVAVGFARHNRQRDAKDLYAYAEQAQPVYLQTGPTTAVSLALHALRNGLKGLRPEIVLTTGSSVDDDIRDIVKDGLGAKIIDRYSCEETGFIALQCPRYEHLHVTNANTHVEIVDDDHRPCGPGTPGRVLLTSMQSYAMPLIRYEVGDLAEWGEPCDCGIKSPVIRRLRGRVRHFITTPDGKRTYARIYARDFQDVPGLIGYRFVLHRNETIVAQLKVAGPVPDVEKIVTERVQRSLGYSYPVIVRFVDAIDWGTSGKQEFFGVSDAPVDA